MKRSIMVVAVVAALMAVSVNAQDAAPLAKITQQLSSPNVNLGDIVYVCLAVENYSGEVVKVTDILPNALSYLPDSLRVNGASAVCTVDRNVVSTYIPGGFIGSIVLQTQVTEAPAVATNVLNTAKVTVDTTCLASSHTCITVWNYCGFHKKTECWDPSYGYEVGVYSVTPIVPMFTQVSFKMEIQVKNLPGDGIEIMENVVVWDRLGGDVTITGWDLEPEDVGDIVATPTGKTAKLHLEWDTGKNLGPGDEVVAVVDVCTDINPGQAKKDNPKYEYTEPCYHELNSGATLKFTDPATGNQLSAHTPPIFVKAVPPL